MKAHSLGSKFKSEIYEKGKKYKLTNQQQGLWFYYKLNPQDNSLNTFVKFKIRGDLDVSRFLRAAHNVVNYFPSCRTYFRENDQGVPYQIIVEEGNYDNESITYQDLTTSSLDIASREKIAEKEIEKTITKPFDLLNEKSNRIILIKTSDTSFQCACVQHHINSDAQSSMLFAAALSCAYNHGKEALKDQFSSGSVNDYFQYLENENKNKANINKKYWQNYINEKDLKFNFGPGFQSNKNNSKNSTVLPLHTPKNSHRMLLSFLGTKLKNDIRLFCKQNRTTPFIFLTTIWSILLRKSFNNKNFLLGYPVNIRPNKHRKIFGYYISMLPLSIKIDDETPFTDFLQQVTTQRKIDKQYEEISLNEIVQNKKQSKDSSNIFDFNVSLSQVSLHTNALSLDGVKIDSTDSSGEQEQDLSFSFDPQTDNLEFIIRYNNELFSSEYIAILRSHLINLINCTLKTPQSKLSDLNIFSEKELKSLLSGFPNPHIINSESSSISHDFSRIASLFPQNTALSYEGNTLTYHELNQHANRLALTLKNKNIGNGDIVAVLAERSHEYVIGILATLKSGAGFLPIDSKLPKNRIAYILNDSSPKLLLKSSKVSLKSNHETLILEEVLKSSYNTDPEELNLAHKEQTAYVIYTSGTTGKPKGVPIKHESIKNNIDYFISKYDVTANDSSIFKTNLAFDTSIQEIFGILTSGGKLTILPEKHDSNLEQITSIITQEKISILQFTPSLLKVFLQNPAINKLSFASVRYTFVGGEHLEANTAKLFYKYFKSATLINAYGPTECCIDVLHYKIPHKFKEIFMGEAISNTKIYVLDENLKPVPNCTPGQLCISGIALTEGYLNKAEITKKQIISNPYSEGKYNKLYLTGDLVKINLRNQISFLGRVDRQVKLRGYRIELGEIEETLKSINNIKECIVTAHKDKLYAYIVSNEDNLDIDVVKDNLGKSLPQYMIPSSYSLIDRIPLNQNGKVDLKSLKKLSCKNLCDENKAYVSPTTKLEKEMVSIWETILNISAHKISINDSFFDLGGHSLKAIELTHMIAKQLNYEVAIQDIFNYQTIKSLTKFIEGKNKLEFKSITSINDSDFYQASQAQKRLFILRKITDEANDTSFNMPFAIKLSGEIDKEKINQCFKTLIDRHESFRTSFHLENNQIIQKIHEQISFNILFIEKPQSTDLEIKESINKLIRPFDLTKAPLIRAALITKNNQESILFVDKHHIISDGISIEIFLQELSDLYQDKELKPLAIKYKDYAAWHNEFLKSDLIEQQKQYWLQQLKGEPPIIELPYDFPRPKQAVFEGDTTEISLSSKISQKIKSFCSKNNITEYVFFLSCFGLLLHKYSGQEQIHIGTPLAGRRHKDSKNIIGFFVNLFCLKLTFEDTTSISDFVQQTKQTFLDGIANQDYPFDNLVEDLNFERDLSRQPLFDVMLTLDRQENSKLTLGNNIKTERFDLNLNKTKYDLTLNCITNNNNFTLSLEFATNLFTKRTANNLLESLDKIISDVATQKENQITKLTATTEAQQKEILSKTSNNDQEFDESTTVIDLIRNTALLYPNKTAIIQDGNIITYQEMENRANQLAHFLQEKYNASKAKNKIVALFQESSFNLIISIIATQKAGLTYLPLDPNHPAERLEYIFLDTELGIILTDNKTTNLINNANIKNYNLDAEADRLSTYPKKNISLGSKKDLSYLIYTSGTTGKPKGVMITQRNLHNLIQSLAISCDITTNDKILSLAKFSFDMSVPEIYLPLTKGASLVLTNQQQSKDPEQLMRIIEDNEISFMQATPSTCKMLLAAKWQGRKEMRLLIGAEAVSKNLVSELLTKFKKIYHAYGPTETTVWSLISTIDDLNYSLGKPIHNTQIYILDKNKNLTPSGCIGELYIAGSGVAAGYYNNPQLSAEKFTKNPFGNGKYSIIYKTGDLVKQDQNGNIHYIGRSDFQVKIRGYRMELGEIEFILNQHPRIVESVITTQQHNDGELFLTAYYTRNKIKEANIKDDDLRQYLAQKLPQYMIPSFFMEIDSFPLTENGKIDRKFLPKFSLERLTKQKKYIAPTTNFELEITKIWSEILNIPTDKISVNDNFFNLGGHSLNAITLTQKISSLSNKKFYPEIIFKNPTIAKLAQIIESGNLGDDSLISTIQEEDNATKNLIFFHPSGGVVNQYYDLAKNLHTSSNIFAIKSPEFLETKKVNYSSIGELAKIYANEITKTISAKDLSDKELILSGWSLGGFIAVEVAKILSQFSPKIIAIDSLIYEKIHSKTKQGSDDALDFFLYYYFEITHKITLDPSVRKWASESFDNFFSLLKKHGLSTDYEYEYFLSVYKAYQKHSEIFTMYNDDICNFHTSIIQAINNNYEEKQQNTIKQLYPKSRIIKINGDHHTIFHKNLNDLTTAFVQALETR